MTDRYVTRARKLALSSPLPPLEAHWRTVPVPTGDREHGPESGPTRSARRLPTSIHACSVVFSECAHRPPRVFASLN